MLTWMTNLTISDALIVVSTLLSPLIALEVQRRLEVARERRRQREQIFHTLMATRAARVDPAHVRALNMIDLVFCERSWRGRVIRRGDDALVQRACKEYLDTFNQLNEDSTEGEVAAWRVKNEERFVQLLLAMSVSLGHDFDKVALEGGIYSPRVHGEIENDQVVLRRGLAALMRGEISLPVNITGGAMAPQEAEQLRKVNTGLLELLEGRRTVSVMPAAGLSPTAASAEPPAPSLLS